MQEYQYKEIEVDTSVCYHFPEFKEVEHNGLAIVIFPVLGKWLILYNQTQKAFWQLLQSYNIDDALIRHEGSLEDAERVIAQIEGKSICNSKPFEKRIPFRLHFHITNECNLRCRHCYMNADKHLENELSTSEIISLLNTFRANGGEELCLTGGEPTIRKDFKRIVDHAYNLGLDIDILTNGLLLTEKLINEIGPKVRKLQISIDGYNEEENAKVRGKGTFDVLISKLRLLDKYLVNTEVAVTPLLTSDLETKIEKYAEFGQWLMSEFSNSISSVNFTGDLMDGRDLHISEEDRKRYQKIAEQIYIKCYNRNGDEVFAEYHKRGGLEGNCSFGNLFVTAVGDIYFCSIFKWLKPYGNVRTTDMDTLIKKLDYVRQKAHVSVLSPCKECELRFICGGECKVKYFKDLRDNRTLIANNDAKPQRRCDENTKKYYYDMMVRTNEATLV